MKLGNSKEIDLSLRRLVASERKITHEILIFINAMEACRGFAEFGYSSMFAYLTRGLGYSEDSAYRRLSAARLLKDVPEAAEKLRSGEMNLTQAAHIQKSVNASLSRAAQIQKTTEAEL